MILDVVLAHFFFFFFFFWIFQSTNLLVASLKPYQDVNLKLCDFGIARKVDSNMTSAQGTALWMAPEVFAKEPYSIKADIWSFGIIVGEVSLRQEPFAGLTFFEALDAVGRAAVPPLPDNVPVGLKDLRSLCLLKKAEERADAKLLVKVCRALLTKDETAYPSFMSPRISVTTTSGETQEFLTPRKDSNNNEM
jgi:serine/threonine protein kinase